MWPRSFVIAQSKIWTISGCKSLVHHRNASRSTFPFLFSLSLSLLFILSLSLLPVSSFFSSSSVTASLPRDLRRGDERGIQRESTAFAPLYRDIDMANKRRKSPRVEAFFPPTSRA